jgi:N6-L-threonylcarbamoyladenine synthase
MLIFSIETSCDETAASILEFNKNGKFKVLANQISSQIKIHAEWGGIVPNLAAREHSKNIIPVIDSAFKEANIKPEEIDLFCVTAGPGLIPALLIGVNVAKTLSYFYKKPLINAHHVEGHIYSNLIKKNKGDLNQIKFPALNLVISGGHTQLILMKDHLNYEIIGQTQDDAVGEAFDKVAKMLNFEYPGGPIISARTNEAEKLIEKGEVDEKYLEIEFPRPMLQNPDLNFSFSGLKTAVLYFYQKLEEKNLPKAEMNIWKKFIVKAFQDSVVEVLKIKTLRAIKKHSPKTVLLSGGVSANSKILETLKEKLSEEYPEIYFSYPEKPLTGDNAAMIGAAGIAKYLYGDQKDFKDNWKNLEANSNLKLSK